MVEQDPLRPERLGKAPIVEALIDIQIEPHVVTLEALAPFDVLALPEFPERKRVIELRNNVDLTAEEPKLTSAPPEVKGHAFWTADKKRVVQARVNGFALSHLAPYDRWSSLRSDALSWWEKFSSIAAPKTVTRCALRFINRIELPLPFSTFEEYLRTFPQIGPALPQGLSGAFARLVIPFGSATVVVTQAIDEAGATAGMIPVILDIDVFEKVSMRPDGADLWSKMEDLRKIKNDVFFGSLTPKAWKLFE